MDGGGWVGQSRAGMSCHVYVYDKYSYTYSGGLSKWKCDLIFLWGGVGVLGGEGSGWVRLSWANYHSIRSWGHIYRWVSVQV